MKKIWPFSFYFLYFAATSALIPYLVLYYQEIGLSGAQTGILTGLAPLISLFGAPLLTGFADAQHRHRLVIGLTLGGVILSILLIPFTERFVGLLPLIAISAFIGSPIISLADSATMTMLGERRGLYGRIRSGGTIGWGLAAPLAGLLIENNGLRWAFWLYAAGMFAALLVSQGLHFGPVSAHQPFRSGFKILMSNRRWLLFLAMVFMAGMGMATISTYLFPFMEQVGANRGLMGLSQSVATLAELPFLFFANHLIKRYGARGLLVLSMAVVGVRLLLYAAFPTPAAILVIQLLHGLTFATIWVAGVSYAHDHAPAGLEATAQGVFGSTMMGVGAAAGNFFGGLLLAAVGGQQMYLFMGLTVLISLGFFLLFENRYSAYRSKQIAVPPEAELTSTPD
jgi:MFS transporter, PPP family, 3-phenylpropionic acid transporter